MKEKSSKKQQKKRPTFFVCSECKKDCGTRTDLDNHWMLEH